MENIFDIANSVKAGTRVCTQEEFERVLDSSVVKAICEKIEKTPVGEDFHAWKEAIAPLKKQLPVLLPHAHFTDGRRHKESAEESPWMSMDFDGVENPVVFWKTWLEPRVEDLGIVLAFVSPSKRGVKVISLLPEGMTREEGQAWFAKKVGVEEYDHTHDLARCVYLVPREYVLLYKAEMMFGTAPSPSKGGEETSPQPSPKEREPGGEGGESRGGKESREQTINPTGLTALPYSKIIPAFFKMENEDFPNLKEGTRNDTIFNVVAKYLRYCTDHNAILIKELLYPKWSFGLSESEIDSVIKSGLSRERSLTPKKVKTVIREMSSPNDGDDNEVGDSTKFPEMPNTLPEFIRLITSKVPDCYKPAVATQIFPALAAHLHQVKFLYIDNTEHEAGLMGVCIAQQSVGKGCVNKPIDCINSDLITLNERNKEMARKWRKDSAESEDDTLGLLSDKVFFPLPLVNMTDAAFTDRLRRLEHNDDRTMFMKLDEIELLYQVNVGGNLKPDRLICIAYDRSEYGQERVAANSISDSAKMRWNWTASTTPPNARLFFSKSNSFLNGALTRLNICTIFQPDDKNFMPRYGIYDEAFQQKVDGYVARLNMAEGLIQCPKVNSLIERLRLWCVDKADEYTDKTERKIFCDFYKRSLVISFRKAMVLYIASGRVWTKSMDEFIEWSLKYDLWCKLYFFSDLMLSAYKSNKPGATNMATVKTVTKMDLLYQQLPDNEFSVKEVDRIRESLNVFSPSRRIICTLKKEGLIEKVGNKIFRKCESVKM